MSLLPNLLAFVLLGLSGPASTPGLALAPSVGLTAVAAPEALVPPTTWPSTPSKDEPSLAASPERLESPFELPVDDGHSPLGWVLGLWFGGSVVLVALWGLAGRLVGRQNP